MVFWKDSSWRAKIVRWLRRSLPRFFHLLSIRDLSLQVRLGLSDPGETGALYGYFLGASGALADQRNKNRRLVFDPVFERECLEAEGGLRISTSLFRLCIPLIFALLTFPYLHTFLLFRRARRMG